MSDPLSIAGSALVALGTRLTVSASNIANADTTGRLPDAANPVSTVYKPLNVSQTALFLGNGVPAGVSAQVVTAPNGTSAAYDPTDPNANKDGLIAVPNVDLGQESVNLVETKDLYKANLAVIKTEEQMQKDLLDVVT